jgi:hypothetical protein
LEVGRGDTYATAIRVEPFAVVEGFGELEATALVVVVGDVAVGTLPDSGLAYGF